MKLTYLDELPENFSTIALKEIGSLFQGPTLISLRGSEKAQDKKPLFLSTLLHGNETTGFLALQEFFREIPPETLPRPLILFIGNIKAAIQGVRHLEDEEDFNRVWDSGMTPGHLLAREVMEYAQKNNIEASIDIHNNTGKNPYYACVNRTTPEFLHFASQFSDPIIYFTEPHEVLSNAFANLCPSLTLECGLPGKKEGIDYLLHFLKKIIFNYDFCPREDRDYNIFHTVGRIKLRANSTLDFQFNSNSSNDYSFLQNFDEMNFTSLPPQTLIGYKREGSPDFCVLDNRDKVVTHEFFDFSGGEIKTRKEVIPSMFTQLIPVALSDSLGYLMVKYAN